MLQFVDKKYKTDHDPTIGVEFGSRNIQLKGKTIKLQVWDTVKTSPFPSKISLLPNNRLAKNHLDPLQDHITEGKNLNF